MSAITNDTRRCRLLAGLLIGTAALLHLLYLASNHALDLSPDEAHYWHWSRHLDWSYYSKGPLVAFLIRGSCDLFGAWSEHLTGNQMLAVRLPAVLCGSLLLVSLYVLTVQVFGRDRLALAVIALALTLPIIAAGSSLMTIDSPYTCCWGWALVLGHRAFFHRSPWAWPVTGLLIGLGILAKYTMVLWLPAAGLFLLTDPERRRLLGRPGFWIMTAVAALCSLPILFWNQQHGWVTFQHNLGHTGLNRPTGIRWLGPLSFVAVQFALLLGYWFTAWLLAMCAHRPWKEPDAGLRYLWWMSATMFGVFFLFGFKTGGGEPNWPVTAYLSGLVLATAWLERRLASPRTWLRRLTAVGLAAACALGLAGCAFMHFSTSLHSVLARLSGPVSPQRPFPLRRFDPTCRLRGWKTLAAEIDRIRDTLRLQGLDPLLAGAAWSLPGELAFYCQGQPETYSFGLGLGDRWSQYDLWHPNPVADPDRFRGQSFLLVGNLCPALAQAFEDTSTTYVLNYQERGQPIASWQIILCRGFKGFPPNSATHRY